MHSDSPASHPLVAPWAGPFGGVPPFDRLSAAALVEALEFGMREQLAAVERIGGDPEPPTFTNTIVPLERASQAFGRVAAVYGVATSALADEAMQAVEREMAPKLAAFADRITQDRRLFARIDRVYASRAEAGLSAEQERLCWMLRGDFIRGGAALDDSGQRELTEINQRLAALGTNFAQNVLADEQEKCVFIEDATGLAGLSEPLRSAAAAAAAARGRPDAWAIENTRSAVEPFLASAERRDLRERVWRMFVGRGEGGPHDNTATVAEILRLRAGRARLLGFPTHAHWQLERSMAGGPEKAIALMETVWQAAVRAVRREVAAMQAAADAAAAGLTIEPWDHRFYAEQVRRSRYDLDEAEVTPYLQLERLREGMFDVAARLFDLHFTAVPAGTVPVWHPDVRVWEVRDGGQRHVGLWYFDPFARRDKRSGAWMSSLRSQARLVGDTTAIVTNTCNFMRPAPGLPVTISWDDATTLFHEFGHALHGLCSAVGYPSVSGTNVPSDYVEFPSQVLEHWLSTPEVLGRHAVHVETGRPLPPALLAKLDRAAAFNQGFKTVEFLASALVDMRLHMAEPPVDPVAFERETLEALGMPREIVMRHRTPHFAHIFSDDGYSAAYYSYLWADVLTADAWEAFTEAGGPWDADVAARLRREVFAAGNTLAPEEGYRRFRGRAADPAALLRKRGFVDGSGLAPA